MTFYEAIHKAGREYLEETLARAGGSVAKAAKIAGVSRSYFYKLLARDALPKRVRGYRTNQGNAAWISLGH